MRQSKIALVQAMSDRATKLRERIAQRAMPRFDFERYAELCEATRPRTAEQAAEHALAFFRGYVAQCRTAFDAGNRSAAHVAMLEMGGPEEQSFVADAAAHFEAGFR